MSGRIHGACSAYCTSLEDSVFSEIHSDDRNVGGKPENQVPSFSGSSCRSVPLTYFAPTTLVFGFSFKSELFPSQGLHPCCFFLSSVPPLDFHVLQEAIGLSGNADIMKILCPPIDLQCSPTKGGLFPGLLLAHHHVIVLHILFRTTYCYILSLPEIIC